MYARSCTHQVLTEINAGRRELQAWRQQALAGERDAGERAIIAADIGQHCVIGAGSVVTKPIPDYAIAVGVPAKVIRQVKAE